MHPCTIISTCKRPLNTSRPKLSTDLHLSDDQQPCVDFTRPHIDVILTPATHTQNDPKMYFSLCREGIHVIEDKKKTACYVHLKKFREPYMNSTVSFDVFTDPRHPLSAPKIFFS